MERYLTTAVVCLVLQAFLAALFVLEHGALAVRLTETPWWQRLLFPPLAGWRAGWKRLAIGWWACLIGWVALWFVPGRWLDLPV